MPGGASKRVAAMRHLLWWAAVFGAVALPFSLLESVGLDETWEAFDRYTTALLSFPERHTLRVPATADAMRNYTALDEDLVGWHADMSSVYGQCTSMAVVGQMTDSDIGMEFAFNSQQAVGAGVKRGFYVKRDLPILLYLALSLLAYTSRSVPLALLVLCLNVFNLGICLRLKRLTDALSKSVEQLQDAQQALLWLPMEVGALEMQQQALCLQKLRAMCDLWQGNTFGYSIHMPLLGSLSVSMTLMASLAAATTVRCSARILRGLPPELRQLVIGRRRVQQQEEKRHNASAAQATNHMHAEQKKAM